MLQLERLPNTTWGGAEHMAYDEVLLERADRGRANLRFYAWATPTLSLGYFQAAANRETWPGLSELPWVRRASGGAALVHDHELTYAIAVPSGNDWQPHGVSWICRMHEAIRQALASFGVEVTTCGCGQERKLGEFLCFLHHTPGDLLYGSHKIAGSAQRRLRGATLQHGGILLRQSPFTPQLPGIYELTGIDVSAWELAERIATTLSIPQIPSHLSESEKARLHQIQIERYEDPAWNHRR